MLKLSLNFKKQFLILQYKRFSTTKEREDHILEIINVVDSYYKKINMRVVLSHIEYWKENRIELDTNAENVS